MNEIRRQIYEETQTIYCTNLVYTELFSENVLAYQQKFLDQYFEIPFGEHEIVKFVGFDPHLFDVRHRRKHFSCRRCSVHTVDAVVVITIEYSDCCWRFLKNINSIYN